MRSAGLRNKPVDRRYLSDQDKSDYNNSGEYGSAARALSRARQYRGQQAYKANKPESTVTRRPGTGANTSSGQVQRDRMRKVGTDRQTKAQDVSMYRKPSSKGDIFKPNDPA